MDTTLVSVSIRVIEAFAQLYLLSSIVKKRLGKKEYFIIVAIIVLAYELCSAFLPSNYNYKSVIMILIGVPTVSIIGNIKAYKVLLGYIIMTLIIVILDMLGGLVLLYLLDVEKFSDITNSPLHYYMGRLILNLLIFISAVAIRYFKMTFAKEDNNIKNLGISFSLLSTLLFIFTNIIIIISYVEGRKLSMGSIVINIVSMLAILILNIFNSQRQYNLLISEKELEYEKNYNITLQSLVDSLRTFKHDYSNTLATLYGYVQLDNIKSLKRMFKEILEESREISSLDKLNPNLIKDPNIFGLVTNKYQKCIKNNINMNFEILGELENISIRIYDLTRILGIFLDNAIEAAGSSKERKVNFLIAEEKGQLGIEISNTYSDKALSVNEIYEKGVSSKGTNRGLGLYKVKEILKKYPDVALKTVIADESFLQRLTIPKVEILA